MTAILKPCPFCGGHAKQFEESLDERFAYANKITIRCSGCNVAVSASGIIPHGGYADNSTTDKRAVAAWNRRAPEDALRAALEAVRSLITHPLDIGYLEMPDGNDEGLDVAITGPMWKTINKALK